MPNKAAPIGGPGELVGHHHRADEARVGDAERRRGHDVGHQCAGRVVGQGLGRAEQEHGGVDDRGVDGTGDDADGQPAHHDGSAHVDDRAQEPTIDSIDDRPGHQAEQHPRQALHEDGQRHCERVGRDGSDQQRTDGDEKPVTEVARLRRRPQPAEAVTQAPRRDPTAESTHRTGRRHGPDAIDQAGPGSAPLRSGSDGSSGGGVATLLAGFCTQVRGQKPARTS